MSSYFQRSVCCLCTRSLYKSCCCNVGIPIIIGLTNLIGCILLSVYYMGLSDNSDYFNVKIAGLILYSLSIVIIVLSNLPPFRFITSNGDFTILLYLMGVSHLIFTTAVSYTNIYSISKPGLDSYLSECTKEVIILFCSINFLWYWMLVFKPLLPNIFYLTKINCTSYNLPYEDRRETYESSSGEDLILDYL